MELLGLPCEKFLEQVSPNDGNDRVILVVNQLGGVVANGGDDFLKVLLCVVEGPGHGEEGV